MAASSRSYAPPQVGVQLAESVPGRATTNPSAIESAAVTSGSSNACSGVSVVSM